MQRTTQRLAQLLAAWAAKQSSGQPPAHGSIKPEDLRFMLPDLCLVDVLPEGGYRFRLAGTGVVERIGRDPTARTLAEVMSPSSANAMAELFELATTTAGPVAGAGRLTMGDADRVLEALCLPMTGSDGTIAVLLVGLSFRAWREIDHDPAADHLDIWRVENTLDDTRFDDRHRDVQARSC